MRTKDKQQIIATLLKAKRPELANAISSIVTAQKVEMMIRIPLNAPAYIYDADEDEQVRGEEVGRRLVAWLKSNLRSVRRVGKVTSIELVSPGSMANSELKVVVEAPEENEAYMYAFEAAMVGPHGADGILDKASKVTPLFEQYIYTGEQGIDTRHITVDIL